MLRHVQCTFPKLSGLFVLVAACSLAACGGSVGSDSVTGTPLSVAPVDAGSEVDLDLEASFETFQDGDFIENDDGTFDSDVASSHRRWRGRRAVCHTVRWGPWKGKKITLWVHKWRLRHHLRHGDTRGRCRKPPPPSATCPCFTTNDINAAANDCSATVESTCSTGDPYFLLLSCNPGGNVPPGVLGIYLSQTANGGECSRDDVNGTVSQAGLTNEEYQACVDNMMASGFCS